MSRTLIPEGFPKHKDDPKNFLPHVTTQFMACVAMISIEPVDQQGSEQHVILRFMAKEKTCGDPSRFIVPGRGKHAVYPFRTKKYVLTVLQWVWRDCNVTDHYDNA